MPSGLEKTLARLDRKIVELLQPGLAQGAIEAELSLRHLPLLQEHATLYGWRNGTDATTGAVLGDLWLVPGFYLLSLGDALANYDALTVSDRWDAAWFPILADGGGDFLALQLPSDNASGGYVCRFRNEYEEHPVEHRSLSDMFATFLAAYDRGIFVDVDGRLEMDSGAYALLAAGMNPDVDYWTC
jgi:hypothetical protein